MGYRSRENVEGLQRRRDQEEALTTEEFGGYKTKVKINN